MRVRDGLQERPVLRLRVDAWPAAAELARLRDQDGVTGVEAAGRVRLGEDDPVGLASWLVSLRDAASALMTVRWAGELALPPELITDLVHLAPPEPVGPAAKLWRDRHPGSGLYYRRGPGFILIKDLRQSRTRMNITLDDPAELELFERITQPVDADELTGLRTQLTEFLDAGLAHRTGPLVVGIATHLRRWPIPHHHI